MSCGWGGSRGSCVALAMRHRLQWFIHLRAHGLRKGGEHPAYTLHGTPYLKSDTATAYFSKCGTRSRHRVGRCAPPKKKRTMQTGS